MDDRIKEFYKSSDEKTKELLKNILAVCKRLNLTKNEINYLMKVLVKGLDKNNDLLIPELMIVMSKGEINNE